MANCQKCGAEVDLPFICSYCRGTYCAYHRLPENHACPNLIMARSPSAPTKSGAPVAGYARPSLLGRGMKIFGRLEAQHLLIAWLVIGFCFSAGAIFSSTIFVGTFTIALLTVGLGFIVHELAHKFTAQKYGCQAEFRAWMWGLAMAIVFALISRGHFIFAAPGATYITPIARPFGWGSRLSRKEEGLISLAGPMTNIALAVIFLLLTGFGGFLEFSTLGYGVNLWLAAFNLLPFSPLDGQKVFTWNQLVWAGITLPLWAIIFLFII